MPRPTRPPDDSDDLDDFPIDDLDDPRDTVIDDLTDDAPDGDDLDLGEEWTEEALVDDLGGPEVGDLPGIPVEMALIDEETDEWDLLEQDHTVPVMPPPDQVALPWSTRASIPALQLDLPATLDPTRADSEWRVHAAPERPVADVLLRVGPVEVRVALKVLVDEPTELVLGRDVLAGRILVRSDTEKP